MIKEIMKYGEAEVTYKNKQLLSEKPKLYNLFWETTLRCNAKCKHCGSRAGEDCNFKDELTTEEIENALQSIANKYNANEILLNITGGEPLVRKDLFEVMKFARNLGYHWGMTTNAMLINDDNIEKMKKSKFDVTYGCTHFVGMKYEKEVRNHMFFCVTGFTTGSILYNGDIYVCPSVERRKELVQGNIRTDDFVDVWENKFKWFRDLDKLKCKECENCKDWKYCRGDSLDTWDFNNNRPKLCLSKMLEGDV